MSGSTQMVDKSLMKRYNRRLVFNEIYRNQPVSRPQLANLSGLTAVSVGRIVDELIALGLVCGAEAPGESVQGRPAKWIRVARERLLHVGVSLEREGVRAGAVDPYGTVAHSAFYPLDIRAMDAREAIDRIAAAVLAFVSSCPEAPQGVVGVSAPGIVEPAEGRVRFSSHFRWENVALAERLKEKLAPLDAVADNDIKARALAEKRFGAASDSENAVLLHIGSGIGAAAVIGGEVYRGQDNTAGEIGHIVLNPNARLCECGKMGCLQTNLADWAILQEARAVQPDVTLDGLFEGFARGVPWMRALVERVVQHACMAVSLLVNAYAPGAVVLCGSLVERYPLAWDLIEAAYRGHLNEHAGCAVTLRRSTFGVEGGMIGASALAFSQTLARLNA